MRSRGLVNQLNFETSEVAFNSFDMDVSVSEDDFVATDFAEPEERQLAGPWQSDGGLSLITLLRLRPGSGLVDRGVDGGCRLQGPRRTSERLRFSRAGILEVDRVIFGGSDEKFGTRWREFSHYTRGSEFGRENNEGEDADAGDSFGCISTADTGWKPTLRG